VLAAVPAISFGPLLPELILVAAGCAVLLAAQAGHDAVRRAAPWLALGGVIAAIMALRIPGFLGGEPAAMVFRGGMWFGSLAEYVRISALVFGLIAVLVNWAQPNDRERGEYFSMMLFSLAGLMLVGASSDLLVLFMALELVSIPTYIMVALSRRNPLALEGGTKYFYLGAMSAAITAFGFSYIYGVTGSMSLDEDALRRFVMVLADPGEPAYFIATIGLLVSLTGLFFKIAAVPLHFYIADVYQGSASPVAGFLGFVPKLAGLAAIFKIISLTNWNTYDGPLFWILWLAAVASMTVGNVLALRQTNIKRMLGYSGIAHSGYMLVGILAAQTAGPSMMSNGPAAVLYYVLIYGLANLGAFALLGLLRVRGRPCETLHDIAGILRTYPAIALLMALAMFTLMGLPPTPGFWGKLSLFGSALSAADAVPAELRNWMIALVIIAVLNSALAAAYYLRVIAAVLLFENDEPAEPSQREAPMFGALLCGFLLLFFAFYPKPIMRIGRHAAQNLHFPSAIESVENSRTPPADLPAVEPDTRI